MFKPAFKQLIYGLKPNWFPHLVLLIDTKLSVTMAAKLLDFSPVRNEAGPCFD